MDKGLSSHTSSDVGQRTPLYDSAFRPDVGPQPPLHGGRQGISLSMVTVSVQFVGSTFVQGDLGLVVIGRTAVRTVTRQSPRIRPLGVCREESRSPMVVRWGTVKRKSEEGKWFNKR